jgi:hypothetical protein
MAQERAERVQWCKKAATLSEQVHIECTDLQGRLGGQTFAELEESGTLDELRERIQRLKDNQAEQPLNADSDADYFLTDVWTKYAMLNIGSAVTINDINEYQWHRPSKLGIISRSRPRSTLEVVLVVCGHRPVQ